MLDSKTIIERLGGASEVARMCGITPQAVSQWYGTVKEENGTERERSMPKSWRMFLMERHPEVFGAAAPKKAKA